jgi:hypothetical protein
MPTTLTVTLPSGDLAKRITDLETQLSGLLPISEVIVPNNAFDGFGNAVKLNDTTFHWPIGADWWAGFRHEQDNFLSFPNGGVLSFDASSIGGTLVTVRFKYEHYLHPNNTPSFDVGTQIIDNDSTNTYSMTIPINTYTYGYKSLILYVDTSETQGGNGTFTEEVKVNVSNITVTRF